VKEDDMRSIHIGVLALLGLIGLPAAPVGAKTSTFVAILNGGQEVPPVTTTNFGVAFLTFDTRTKMLCYAINYNDVEGDETVTHVHGPAAPQQPANPIVDIFQSGRQKNGCVVFPAQFVRSLKKGLTYVNIHSTRFPTGELRGQILPTGR
jgi:hypothetical protein